MDDNDTYFCAVCGEPMPDDNDGTHIHPACIDWEDIPDPYPTAIPNSADNLIIGDLDEFSR